MTTVTTLSGHTGIAYSLDGTLSESDASAFWARLPEKVAIALVKAAPKVAGPWFMYNGDISYAASRDLGDTCPDIDVLRSSDGGFYWEHCGDHSDDFTTLAEAQAGADAYLQAKGWLLDSDPEAQMAGLSAVVTELGGGK